MQQFRLAESRAFHCFRCGQPKKSKLLAQYAGDWDRLLCNGCYGRLLSIFKIKAGTASDEDKAEALADALLGLYTEDQLRGRRVVSPFREACGGALRRLNLIFVLGRTRCSSY